nr:uncharacterized protein LOC111994490 [Quercus suber]
MTKLPTVCVPMSGKPLKLYLATNSEAVRALIAQDDQKGADQPVYYVSRMLKDAETQYSRDEKAFYLMTKSHPICSLLWHPVLFGRLAQWLLQLSEFEIIPIAPTAVKRQAIADLLAWFPGEEGWDVADEVPGDLPEVSTVEATGARWILRFDGSFIAAEGGAGIVLIKETGEAVTMSFKLDFPCTNNTAEYEAYLTGLAVACEMGIKHLRAIGDSNLVVCQAKGEFALKELSLTPYRAMAQMLEDSFEDFNIQHSQRSDNFFADALATLGARFSFEVLKEEFFDQPLDQADWWSPVKEALLSPSSKEQLKCFKDYTLVVGKLYRKFLGGVLARCLGLSEFGKRLREVHEKSCGSSTTVSLYRRL